MSSAEKSNPPFEFGGSDRGSQFFNELLTGLVLALVAVGTFFLAFGITFRFDIPVRYLGFRYFGDFISLAAAVKGMVENSWIFFNPSLGAPLGSHLQDLPVGENLNWLMFKLISLGTSDPVTIINIGYVLTYPLAAVAAYASMRALAFSRPTSFVLGLLFAFLPFHQAKGTFHFFHSNFFPLPLMVLVFLWIQRGSPSGISNPTLAGTPRFWTWKRLLLAFLFAVLVASTNFYFTFFSCYFLLFAGMRAYLSRKDGNALRVSWLLILVLLIVPVLHNLPTFIFNYHHGPNSEIMVRNPAETDMFSLRLDQMLLPHLHHRLAFMKELREIHIKAYPDVVSNNEEIVSSALGTVATLGFLYLLSWLLFFKQKEPYEHCQRPTLVFDLFLLAFAGMLLGTRWGIGSLFNVWVISTFRCYNRLSPFIAFFSLLALGTFFDRLVAYWTGKNQQWKAWSLAVLIGAAGIWDQTYTEKQPVWEHESDHAFVQSIEISLPSGAMIFQLPIVSFPENGQVYNLLDYDHFRGYLHSQHLRWSFGSMRGREGDAWQQKLKNMPFPEMIKAVQAKGFAGIWLDLAGYPREDNPAAWLTNNLGKSIAHPTGRIIFFPFSHF